jgi:hypothetical protein
MTYQPDRAHLAGRRVLSGAFLVVGLGLALLGCTSGLALTAATLALGVPVGAGMGVGVAVAGLVGGLACAGVGIWLWRTQAGGAERVVLTEEALTLVTPGGSTTLRLDEIVALEAEWTPARWVREYGAGDLRTRYPPYWLLVVRDRHGEVLELQIAFPGSGMMSTFDVLPILRALLARLPEDVPVDPRLVEYAETGVVPRGG